MVLFIYYTYRKEQFFLNLYGIICADNSKKWTTRQICLNSQIMQKYALLNFYYLCYEMGLYLTYHVFLSRKST